MILNADFNMIFNIGCIWSPYEFLYDFEGWYLYDYECGSLWCYECRSRVRNIAGEDECAFRSFHMPRFSGYHDFPGCPGTPESLECLFFMVDHDFRILPGLLGTPEIFICLIFHACKATWHPCVPPGTWAYMDFILIFTWIVKLFLIKIVIWCWIWISRCLWIWFFYVIWMWVEIWRRMWARV